MKHLYLVWPCKTPNCKKLHAAKYLGERAGAEGFIPLATKGRTFSVECPRCLLRHEYRATDLRELELDAPPPSLWRDLI